MAMGEGEEKNKAEYLVISYHMTIAVVIPNNIERRSLSCENILKMLLPLQMSNLECQNSLI